MSAPPSSSNHTPKTILAIDCGAYRTGLAVGQDLTCTTQALRTLQHAWYNYDFSQIGAIITRWRPNLILVGYPSYTQDSHPSSRISIERMQRKVDQFIQQLLDRYKIECRRVNENYSSATAYAQLKHARQTKQMKQKITRADIDAQSAVVLLESWFADLKFHAMNKNDD